jgi:hypothetical protein
MAKGILEEIRNQPPHIREIFMWVCVVLTFSVVGFSWFKSTTRQFAALVNPEQYKNSDMLAEKEEQSPFATISKAWGGLTANIKELFDFSGKANSIEIENGSSGQKAVEPNLLPLTGDRK